MLSELFKRRDFQARTLEPAIFREQIQEHYRQGGVTSGAERMVERFHYYRYVQLTGDNLFLPASLRNVAVRPFWRRGVPHPLPEDRWASSCV